MTKYRGSKVKRDKGMGDPTPRYVEDTEYGGWTDLGEQPTSINESRGRANELRDKLLEWFGEVEEKARKKGGTAMGPPGINHEALTQMEDHVLNLEVVYQGLERLAPDIDSQTVYVLNQLNEAANSILADSRIFFDLFDSFVRNGPEEGITFDHMTKLDASEYLESLSVISRNTSKIYVSHGMVQNAITMMKMQQKIAKKHVEFSKSVNARQMGSLIGELEKLDNVLFDVQGVMEELQDETKKVKRPKTEIYPLMTTRNGKEKADKLYFMVALKYLDVMEQMHKLDIYLKEILKGISEITTNPEHTSPHRGLEFTERKLGSFDKSEHYRKSVYEDILATYLTLNSKAMMFPAYEVVDMRVDTPILSTLLPHRRLKKWNRELHQNLDVALRESE